MKIVKKLYSMSPYFFIIIIALSTLLWELGVNGDEIWNYNFARNLSNGLVPYRDFNMVQTPFAAYIGAFWMVLFGPGFIVYKIMGVVLMSAVFSLFYKTIKEISKREELAFAVTIFYMLLIYNTWIYNYNTLNLLIIVIVFYIELHKSNYKKYEYIMAVLIGLMPMIKQTTGACVIAAYFAIEFFDNSKSKKRSFIQLVIMLIPSILYSMYLICAGMFWDFIDYAVVGIKYFTHKITYFDFVFSSPVNFAIGLGFVVMCCLTIKNVLKIEDKHKKAIIIRLTVISLAAGVVAYPLTDISHILLAIMPYMICWFLSMIDLNITKKEGMIIYLVVVCLVVVSMPIVIDIDEKTKISSLNNFEYTMIDEDMESNIVSICEFIENNRKEGIDVYITNEAAAVYMIPLDIYNKNFDMLLLGNLGTNTVEDLLNVDDESLFLMNKNIEDINWQCHIELIDYITENYECVGEIINYDIYRKNTEK